MTGLGRSRDVLRSTATNSFWALRDRHVQIVKKMSDWGGRDKHTFVLSTLPEEEKKIMETDGCGPHWQLLKRRRAVYHRSSGAAAFEMMANLSVGGRGLTILKRNPRRDKSKLNREDSSRIQKKGTVVPGRVKGEKKREV